MMRPLSCNGNAATIGALHRTCERLSRKEHSAKPGAGIRVTAAGRGRSVTTCNANRLDVASVATLRQCRAHLGQALARARPR